jgi:4'-phosphopantetheinyl transferase
MAFPAGREVQLWYASPADFADAEARAAFAAWMSPEEHARHKRYAFAKDRDLFLVARGLIRVVLARTAGVDPGAWRFVAGPNGKPRVAAPAGREALRFNLTHTDGLVACAVAIGREVGVDAEDMERRGSPEDLAARFFAAAENDQLARAPAGHRRELFFRFWTLKEAYIKARGLGLSLPLADFSFDLSAPGPPPIAFAPAFGDDPRDWQFAEFRPTPRHALALAVHRPAGEDLAIIPRAFDRSALRSSAGPDGGFGVGDVLAP